MRSSRRTFIIPSTDPLFLASASLSLAVGGDLGDSYESLTVSVNGEVVGDCGDFGSDCNVPLEACLSTIDVTDVALASGSVQVRGQADSDVNAFCDVYDEFLRVALILEATLVLTLSETASPTVLPTTSPEPTTSSPTAYRGLCELSAAVSPYVSIEFEPGVSRLGISDTDDDVEQINLPFVFPWFSATPTSIIVSSNGQINLDGSFDNNCCDADPISPLSSYVGERIAFAQEDLRPGGGGSVFYLDKGTSVVVSFEQVPFYFADGLVNVQVELYEFGLVEIRYGAGDTAGNSMAAGVQSSAEGIYSPVLGSVWVDGVTSTWPTNDGVLCLGSPPTAMPTTTAQPTTSPPPSTLAPTGRMIRVGEVVPATLSAGAILEFHVVGVDEAISVTFSTCGSDVDAVMSLWEGSVRLEVSDNCFCCSDTADGWRQAAMDWTLSTGADYTIQIQGSTLFETGLIQLTAQKATPNKNSAQSYPDVAEFSGRGPTGDNRIKPDVVAPGGSFTGTSIYSAASSSSAATKSCSIRPEIGTSMACPVVAGLMSLLTEYFRKGYYPTGVAGENAPMVPMGAALKALVVASAQYLAGSEANARTAPDATLVFPNYDQGHGFVVTDSIFDDTTSLFVDGDYDAMPIVAATDDRHSYTFVIEPTASPTDELRVVLCWHDPAALPFATGRLLINDLDLVVEGPNGTVVYPNFGHAAGDHLNTVERVIATGLVPGGVYTATVSVSTLVVGPQPFALVATGPFVKTPELYADLFVPTTSPTSAPTYDSPAPTYNTASPTYDTPAPSITRL
mmetsp:Transcript_26443/g.105828  ORF Transcript_26443/g.105828 Transcript_26443/m.105828 type:complete len:792 (-) Transcript_26443:188-2563(-)